MKNLIIYGASFGDVIKLIDAINRTGSSWNILGFLDDTSERWGKDFMGYNVLGGRELLPDLANRDNTYCFNNVNGSRSGNKSITGLLDGFNCKVPSLVHPSVDLGYVKIGRGCIIPDGCVIGANVTIGNFVTFRYRSIVSHDIEIGDHVLIGPGVTLGGRSKVGKGCVIGAGASVPMETTIGEDAVIGAGTVVIRDVSPSTTVIGVPGKEIKNSDCDE